MFQTYAYVYAYVLTALVHKYSLLARPAHFLAYITLLYITIY